MDRTLAKSIATEIFNLFEQYGAEDYIGEPISQIEHAAQAAQMAEQEGYGEEVILAALFHDIGHICGGVIDKERMGDYGVQEHERLGGDYLRQKGFSDTIVNLVESHVTAKRYLTYKYPEYYQKLSEASKQTLIFQGGPMNDHEASAYEKLPYFAVSLKMREWDERAKVENIPLPDFQQYKQMAISQLEKQ